MQNKPDQTWTIVVSLLILIFSSIPNWVGFASETKELAYRGVFFDPQDYAVHRSMIRSGMQGDWAYQFRFTTESHQPAYTRLFYIALGEINRIPRLDPARLFEIARWIFGAVALFALYILTGRFFKNILWRRSAFLLAVFGSGLGWLQLIFGWEPGPITPIDFWLIDAYVFFGVALFPHFAFVTAALCLMLALYLDYLEKGGWLRVAGIAVIAGLAQFVNPIVLVLVDAAFAAATLTKWIQNRKIGIGQAAALGALVAAQLPLALYNFNLLTNDPVWSLFTGQNETLSPPPLYYAWGFGLLWLFSPIGLTSALRKRNAALLGAAAWTLAGFALAYAPFAIQRRFLHGVTIPLALLSAEGLRVTAAFFAQRFRFFARRRAVFVILFIFLASVSSVYFVLGRSLFLRGRPAEFFYPASLDAAFAWLDDRAAPNDFVLSSAPSGLLAAQETGLRVYLGHPMETLHYPAKLEQVKSFYGGQAGLDWLRDSNVQWVLAGPYERRLSQNDFLPFDGLETAYQADGVTIYRVIK